jgi:hypothetical protein
MIDYRRSKGSFRILHTCGHLLLALFHLGDSSIFLDGTHCQISCTIAVLNLTSLELDGTSCSINNSSHDMAASDLLNSPFALNHSFLFVNEASLDLTGAFDIVLLTSDVHLSAFFV